MASNHTLALLSVGCGSVASELISSPIGVNGGALFGLLQAGSYIVTGRCTVNQKQIISSIISIAQSFFTTNAISWAFMNALGHSIAFKSVMTLSLVTTSFVVGIIAIALAVESVIRQAIKLSYAACKMITA